MTGLELHPRVRNFSGATLANLPGLHSRNTIRKNIERSFQLAYIPALVYRVFVICDCVLRESLYEDGGHSAIHRPDYSEEFNLFILRNFGPLAFAGVSAQEAGLGLFENEDAIFGVGARRQIREYGGEPKDGNAAAESSCHLDAPACKRRQHSG